MALYRALQYLTSYHTLCLPAHHKYLLQKFMWVSRHAIRNDIPQSYEVGSVVSEGICHISELQISVK